MGDKKLGREPAFPDVTFEELNNNKVGMFTENKGMSKRYLTAKDICCALLASNNSADDFSEDLCSRIVEKSYQIADELLKQESL